MTPRRECGLFYLVVRRFLDWRVLLRMVTYRRHQVCVASDTIGYCSRYSVCLYEVVRIDRASFSGSLPIMSRITSYFVLMPYDWFVSFRLQKIVYSIHTNTLGALYCFLWAFTPSGRVGSG